MLAMAQHHARSTRSWSSARIPAPGTGPASAPRRSAGDEESDRERVRATPEMTRRSRPREGSCRRRVRRTRRRERCCRGLRDGERQRGHGHGSRHEATRSAPRLSAPATVETGRRPPTPPATGSSESARGASVAGARVGESPSATVMRHPARSTRRRRRSDAGGALDTYDWKSSVDPGDAIAYVTVTCCQDVVRVACVVALPTSVLPLYSGT